MILAPSARRLGAKRLAEDGWRVRPPPVVLEVLGLMLAVEVIPDTFMTVGNVTGDLAATAIVARGERSRTQITQIEDPQIAQITQIE